MKVLALVLVLGAGVAAAQSGQAQDPVRRQIDAMGAALKAKGLEPAYEVFAGSLKEAESQLVAFHFRRGVSYAVVAACDEDCSDLDMRLLDPAGREVGSDVEPDDTPVIEIVSDKTGEFRVRIEMAECANAPCAFGIGVFATGQDEFDRQVHVQLNDAVKQLGREGFSLTHQIVTGSLKQKEYEEIEFELEAGGNYLILGVCDTDCSDLDLELRDAAGGRVDIDEGEDDVPVVAVSVPRTARYTVRAVMISCADEPCRYGVGAVRQQ